MALANSMRKAGRCRRLVSAGILILVTTLFTNIFDMQIKAENIRADFNLYKDPREYFNIQYPSDWIVQEYEQDSRGKVKFKPPGARGVSILIIAKKTNFISLEEELVDVRASRHRLEIKYKSRGAHGGEEITDWYGQLAVVSFFELTNFRQETVSFLVGDQEYTISYAAPKSSFKKFEEIAGLSLRTIEPLIVDGGATADQQTAESKYRLATLAIMMGKPEQAKVYVNEGLYFDPTNENLVTLGRELGIK